MEDISIVNGIRNQLITISIYNVGPQVDSVQLVHITAISPYFTMVYGILIAIVPLGLTNVYRLGAPRTADVRLFFLLKNQTSPTSPLKSLKPWPSRNNELCH